MGATIDFLADTSVDPALQKLASRLLSDVRYSPHRRVKLLLGQLPDDLPMSLPLPEGTSIIGSLVSQDVVHATIVLEVKMLASGVIDFPEFTGKG